MNFLINEVVDFRPGSYSTKLDFIKERLASSTPSGQTQEETIDNVPMDVFLKIIKNSAKS